MEPANSVSSETRGGIGQKSTLKLSLTYRYTSACVLDFY